MEITNIDVNNNVNWEEKIKIQLNTNDPYLFSSAGKKRKEDLIYEFFTHSPILRNHGFSCPVMKDGNYEVDCLICQKFSGMINILAQDENNRNSGKLDVEGMVKKGIVKYMVFGDGIEIVEKK